MDDLQRMQFYQSHYLFRELSLTELKQVMNYGRIRSYKKGEIINYGDTANSKIYFIISGKTKLITYSNENRYVKDILIDNDFFGRLDPQECYTSDYAEVIRNNTYISFIHTSDFELLLQSIPILSLQFSKLLYKQVKKLEVKVEELAMRDVKSRLIQFIKKWAQVESHAESETISFSNIYSQTDIADIVCCSRQSVNNFFSELKTLGLLNYNRKKIEIKAQFEKELSKN
ncbi:MAG TPA: Crp/Fnr family transcriptional regulator [Flavisolibacter sp.]|jgi:CRP/FNR family transcriptional regulator|nr:Crp/Fnr family transcriptional regulator [Flavisolibacter sp.]